VLGPPVEGANWLSADGPSNDQDNHHRRGVVILDGPGGGLHDAYAIDWKQIRDGSSFFWRCGGDVRLLLLFLWGKQCWPLPTAVFVTATRDGPPQ